MSTPPPQVNERCATHFLNRSIDSQQITEHSALSMDRYHALSDYVMDTLMENLELILDVMGNSRYEVEYHVHLCALCFACAHRSDVVTEWGLDA
jgi:hypothetical protein